MTKRLSVDERERRRRARHRQAEAELARRVQQLVDMTPPLTDALRERVVTLLQRPQGVDRRYRTEHLRRRTDALVNVIQVAMLDAEREATP